MIHSKNIQKFLKNMKLLFRNYYFLEIKKMKYYINAKKPQD